MRQPGYYWIRRGDKWEPAEFDGSTWWMIGYDGKLRDRDIDEVGEKIEHFGPTS